MDTLKFFDYEPGQLSEVRALEWIVFLKESHFDFKNIKKINLVSEIPVMIDVNDNQFSIDFKNNHKNYNKKKGSLKTELISRALGAGRLGRRILDLSAGLGIDALFLSQLGYEVTALERNPLIFLALKTAAENLPNAKVHFLFESADSFLKNKTSSFDVIYFDPMFPEKQKSALPRQEMVFFRTLVGDDADAVEVLELARRAAGVQRVVVKRPLKAPILDAKPISQIKGKLIRFDLYGVKK